MIFLNSQILPEILEAGKEPAAEMKVKEVDRTANIAWSPQAQVMEICRKLQMYEGRCDL